MKKFLIIALSAMLLSGCKVDMSTKINTDDLLSDQHKLISGNLSIEVPSCNDFEDSRKDSQMLVDLKEKIPTVFRNAEFKECYKQKFNSFANFEIPIGIGSFRGEYKSVDTDIYIVSTDDVYVGAIMGKDVISRMNSLKKEMPTDLNIKLTLNIEKGKQPIPNVALLGSYMTGVESKNSPILISKIAIESKSIKVKLSDVSNSLLTSGKVTPVLVSSGFLKMILANLEK